MASNMNQDSLLAQLREAFKAEADERLQTLSTALLRLLEPASEAIAAVTADLEQAHRDFHSLKGAASAVGMEDVARLCLESEILLKQLCAAPGSAISGHIDALLAATATVERASLSGISLDEAEVSSLCERLHTLGSTPGVGGSCPVTGPEREGEETPKQVSPPCSGKGDGTTRPTATARSTTAMATVGDLDAGAALEAVRCCIDQLPEGVDTTALRDLVDALDRVLERRQDLLQMLLGPSPRPGWHADAPGSLPVAEGGERSGATGSPRRDRKRILVVEDSLTSRMLVQSILEEEGYLVLTAVDGVEGYARLKTSGADLVVSDIEMPRMNGFEMSQTIRNDTGFQHVPIILVTSLTGEESRARGMEVGANAYIVKAELEQSKLLEVVRDLIAER